MAILFCCHFWVNEEGLQKRDCGNRRLYVILR
jgi:hypothetical protein